jgi:hypothetical protein
MEETEETDTAKATSEPGIVLAAVGPLAAASAAAVGKESTIKPPAKKVAVPAPPADKKAAEKAAKAKVKTDKLELERRILPLVYSSPCLLDCAPNMQFDAGGGTDADPQRCRGASKRLPEVSCALGR